MPSKPLKGQKRPELSIYVVKRLDFAMTELVKLHNDLLKDDRLIDSEHEGFKDVMEAIKEMYVAMELYLEHATATKNYFFIDSAKIAIRKREMVGKSW